MTRTSLSAAMSSVAMLLLTPAQAAIPAGWQSATRTPNACLHVDGLGTGAPASGSLQHQQITIRNDCGAKVLYKVVVKSGKEWAATPIRPGRQATEFCIADTRSTTACNGFADVLFRRAPAEPVKNATKGDAVKGDARKK